MGQVYFLEDGQFCVPDGVAEVRVTLVGAGEGYGDGSYSCIPNLRSSGVDCYVMLEWD